MLASHSSHQRGNGQQQFGKNGFFTRFVTRKMIIQEPRDAHVVIDASATITITSHASVGVLVIESCTMQNAPCKMEVVMDANDVIQRRAAHAVLAMAEIKAATAAFDQGAERLPCPVGHREGMRAIPRGKSRPA